MSGAHQERGSAAAGSGEPSAGGHVRSLDGIRAVAVVLVLLFHLRFPGFSSGFLGVDIFFVLSGFLITTLLLTEHERTGRISLAEFWARRARRLLPALVILLLAVAAVTWARGTFTERASLRGDLLATTGYVANWHLINTSSYFADIGIDSPLEHTWSLAIEEQFYLLWPLIVVGTAALLKRRPQVGVAGVAVAGSAFSAVLLWLLWSTGNVDRAYMGTDARIFEPLVGAVGAAFVALPKGRRWIDRRGGVSFALGAVGLVAGVVLVAVRPSSYPLGGALLVTLATLLLVMSLWLGHGGIVQRSLAWAPIAWIGVVSYGAYLWHWPLVVWLGANEGTGATLTRRLGVIVSTFAIAALSYRLIEAPIRRGRVRASTTEGHRSRSARRLRRTLVAIPIALLAVASISVAATQVPVETGPTPSLMLAGDSVPRHLTVALDRAMTDRGWRVFSATFGSCPVTGEEPARADGTAVRSATHCSTQVVQEQNRIVRTSNPEIVIWWDRWSLSDFLTSTGEVVRSGTSRYWELRREGVRRAVDRLTSGGATVVFVATEPPGATIGVERCTEADCHRFVRLQIDRYDDLTTRWNAMLRRFAERHPDRAYFLSVTDAICRTDAAPCDDRIDGVPARPDGTHYEGVGETVVIATLLRLMAPVMDPLSAPSP